MLYDYDGQGAYVEGEIFSHEVPLLPATDGVVQWGSIATSWCDSAQQCTREERGALSEDENGSLRAEIRARYQAVVEGLIMAAVTVPIRRCRSILAARQQEG